MQHRNIAISERIQSTSSAVTGICKAVHSAMLLAIQQAKQSKSPNPGFDPIWDLRLECVNLIVVARLPNRGVVVLPHSTTVARHVHILPRSYPSSAAQTVHSGVSHQRNASLNASIMQFAERLWSPSDKRSVGAFMQQFERQLTRSLVSMT